MMVPIIPRFMEGPPLVLMGYPRTDWVNTEAGFVNLWIVVQQR
jgi:hypothetical protein